MARGVSRRVPGTRAWMGRQHGGRGATDAVGHVTHDVIVQVHIQVIVHRGGGRTPGSLRVVVVAVVTWWKGRGEIDEMVEERN